MTRIVWKFSFSLYTSNDDSSFRKKYQFWLKNVGLFKKQLIRTVQSVLKSNFDLNQGYKIVLTENHFKFRTFNVTDLFIVLSRLEKYFEVAEIVQKFKGEESWPNL